MGQPQTVKEKPDAYLSELARQFGCTPQTVFYMLLKLKITVKKTFTYAEKSEEQRALFAAKLKMFPAGKRVLPLLVTGIRQTAFFLKTGL
ncbi:MAG: transposase [Treponema sp.]|nr:transposase [Treponema sp.]